MAIKALTCKYMYCVSDYANIHYKCILSPEYIMATNIEDMIWHCNRCEKYKSEGNDETL